MVVIVLALLSLTRLPAGFTPPDLVWRLVLLGIGNGMFMSPNSSAVLGSVPAGRVGTAAGVLAQMRVTGQALGIALSAAVVATRLPVYFADAGGTPSPAQESAALAAAIGDASSWRRPCAPSASRRASSAAAGARRPGSRPEPHPARHCPAGF